MTNIELTRENIIDLVYHLWLQRSSPVTLRMEIDKAVNKTLLRTIEKFCGVSISENYNFYDKELDVQTNSSGWKNQLDDYFKRNDI